MIKLKFWKNNYLLTLILGGIVQPIASASTADQMLGHETMARTLSKGETVLRERFDTPRKSTFLKHVGGYYQVSSFEQNSGSGPSRNIKPTDLPVENYTHLYLAFLNIYNKEDDKRFTVFNPLKEKVKFNEDLAAAKKRNSKLKIIWSVGGASTSKDRDPNPTDSTTPNSMGKVFEDMVADDRHIDKFVKSVIQHIQNHPTVEIEGKIYDLIDGIDIDWEWEGQLAPDKGADYIKLMEKLKGELPSNKILSAAISAGLKTDINWKEFTKHVNHINLMTYSYGGKWSEKVTPHAPLSECKLSVNRLIDDWKVDPSKIILGVSFYGRGFYQVRGASNPSDVFGKKCLKAPNDKDPADGTFSARAFSYFHLHQKFIGEEGWTYAEFLDDERTVSVLFNKKIAQTIYKPNGENISATVASTILCESEATARIKSKYIRDKMLGGVFIWEVGDDNGNLLNALIHFDQQQ